MLRTIFRTLLPACRPKLSAILNAVLCQYCTLCTGVKRFSCSVSVSMLMSKPGSEFTLLSCTWVYRWTQEQMLTLIRRLMSRSSLARNTKWLTMYHKDNEISYIWSKSGEQVWRSVESARLPPLWPGFDSRTQRHIWVEFVVGCLLAPRGFSPGTPVFPSPKNQHF